MRLPNVAVVVMLAAPYGATTPAFAQTFRGVVVDDSTKLPLDNVSITLLTDKEEATQRPAVRSDSLGRFLLHAGDKGRYRVRAARVGYQPVTSSVVSFFTGEMVTLTLSMSPAQQKLGTVVVTEKRRYNTFELLSTEGFELRRSRGQGKFLDTADLAVYRKYPVQMMLADHAGLNLWWDTRIARRVNVDRLVMPGKGLGRDGFAMCEPQVWIDSFESSQWRLMGLGSDMIYGIEVYSHFQRPPASIAAWIGADTSCGLIVVWTKGFAKEYELNKAKNAKREERRERE